MRVFIWSNPLVQSSTHLVFLVVISSGFGHQLQFLDSFSDAILQGSSISTSDPQTHNIIPAAGNCELGFSDRALAISNKLVTISSMSPNRNNSSNATATLLDSGNLVLRKNNSNITLWQSLDCNPSQTFLPGISIGSDRRAGKTWPLRSWKKSLEDPSPGVLLSLEVDPNGTRTCQFFISITCLWGGNCHVLSSVLEMRLNYVFNKYSYSFSKDQSYFTYFLNDDSIISREVFDGSIKRMIWPELSQVWNQLRMPCELDASPEYGLTSRASLSGHKCRLVGRNFLDRFGAEPRSAEPKMTMLLLRRRRTRKRDRHLVRDYLDEALFFLVPNLTLQDNPLKLPAKSPRDCQSACLRNCSCSAYAYDRETCAVWCGELLNVQQLSDANSSTRDIYLKIASSDPNGERVPSSKWKIGLIVLLSISVASASVIWVVRRRLLSKGKDFLLYDFSNNLDHTGYELGEADRLWRAEKKEVDLPMFSFASVSAATNNFSIENKLGEGGFGAVYKGRTKKGYEVAVKRLSERSGQGMEELKNEAVLVSKLQHKNLVTVLGCCIDQDEKIMIYEYMPNKSLDFFLFDPSNHEILYWETRVRIIEGIAQGLLYLHQYSRLRIIHRDLKASNILLDEDMNPKISDFGMARILWGNGARVTKRIAGTYGYMSPEYALEGLFSTKSDVFSFGVLLLEILSGKKNTGFYQTDSLSLLGYAWDLWKEGRGQELMDPILAEETVPRHILLRYINVGLLCVQEIADDRPAMSDVVSMLGNGSIYLPSPKQPAYSNLRSGVEPHVAQNRPEICSLNGVTLSIMEPR